MTVTLQKASTADIDEILPLIREYWRLEGLDGFDPNTVRDNLRQLLTNPNLGLGFVCRDYNGKLVAYLLGVFVFSLENLGITAEIDELFVTIEYRARGIGQELLQAAENAFADLGCTSVSLQVSRDNAGARRFYERLGYSRRTAFELIEKKLRKA